MLLMPVSVDIPVWVGIPLAVVVAVDLLA